MIQLQNISKKFGDDYVIKNINLTFNKNETIVIIGPSGSGKSTLLRSINNLETINSGAVLIDGEKLTKKNRSKLCFKIGMVFQQFHLFPHMNVMDNLTYGPLYVHGVKKSEAIAKAEKLLDQCGMQYKAYEMPLKLSGGQKQRVAICRALMMNPELMLFDEPTSALDPEMIKDVIEIVNILKHQMTMIIVTHHINFAKVIADRVIFMDQGQVLANQLAKDFFIKPVSHRARLFLENVQGIM